MYKKTVIFRHDLKKSIIRQATYNFYENIAYFVFITDVIEKIIFSGKSLFFIGETHSLRHEIQMENL